MLFDADKDVELTNRALRTDGSKNEERGGFPGMSKFAGLLSKAGPSKNIANKLWLRSQTNPTKVFNALRLGEAGVKLDDNPAVLQWLKYVDMYGAKKGNKQLSLVNRDVYVALLKSSKTEADVAKLFQSLKQNPDLAKLGESLQQTQFKSWLIREMQPATIPGLLGLRNGIPTNDPRTEIWKKYALVFAVSMRDKAAAGKSKLSTAELAALLKIFG
ncbi:hypothetical protein PF005_g15304 [Phytophthora fragariae]|uniref:Uncharacterized protein n=1 Tax=Phytophthora fragariae TaxID=53985 RepID=A0A6A3XDC1_9STRA|nr:hypothetical protein PF003_g37355 [Phytophthora fragariae]KAE8922813.1 hypothetical protein PF009_g26924 [Phytophthora fragariae]KAE9088393.1 hypothetical protein PF006_g25591 [Phytophthora fragariae]KAE9100149.1 hypothetical protein PF007_g15634 [Phytophthora fragariae]KAE9200556.1 hypothetical protein PF005_g15304 [Phytophthora fragariae]